MISSFMTVVRWYDTCTNHRNDEADEHNHEAPRHIYAVIPNEKELKNQDIKKELNGKSPSGCHTSQGDNCWRVDEVFWRVDVVQCCTTRPKNQYHTQERKSSQQTEQHSQAQVQGINGDGLPFKHGMGTPWDLRIALGEHREEEPEHDQGNSHQAYHRTNASR